MRKIISSFSVGSVVLGAALALAPVAAQASVQPVGEVLVTVTEYTPDGGPFTFASWDQSSTPTPLSVGPGFSTDVLVSNYIPLYTPAVTDVTWYNSIAGGGAAAASGALNVMFDPSVNGGIGGQVYFGDESAPTFAVGVYTGFVDVNTGYAATITITSVPEASTWALMLLGFAGLGLAGYRASRKSAALAA